MFFYIFLNYQQVLFLASNMLRIPHKCLSHHYRHERANLLFSNWDIKPPFITSIKNISFHANNAFAARSSILSSSSHWNFYYCTQNLFTKLFIYLNETKNLYVSILNYSNKQTSEILGRPTAAAKQGAL